PDDDAIKNMVEMCKGADVVIIGTYNANLNKGQAKLVNKINRINGNTIVVSLRNPYDIMVFDDVPAYICAYEYTKLSLKSVIDVLKGRQKAVGSLPVKIR
ncbi:MAG TPA: beta-N-acetylhexosaminidase, partial [Clostridiaceae bacterium]|nr:beta-N-acetylhexosaminidase [Clostridiaceae bacterium]